MTLFAFVFAGYDFSQPLSSQMDTIKLYYGGLLMFMMIGVVIRFFNRKERVEDTKKEITSEQENVTTKIH